MLPRNLRKRFSLPVDIRSTTAYQLCKSKMRSFRSHDMHKDMHICMYEFVERAYSIMTYNETQRNMSLIALMGYERHVS